MDRLLFGLKVLFVVYALAFIIAFSIAALAM